MKHSPVIAKRMGEWTKQAFLPRKEPANEEEISDQGPPNGGVSNGGVSRSGLVLPFLSVFVLFLSFLGLSRFFGDFPDLLGDGPGIFPIGHFSLSRPIKEKLLEARRTSSPTIGAKIITLHNCTV